MLILNTNRKSYVESNATLIGNCVTEFECVIMFDPG